MLVQLILIGSLMPGVLFVGWMTLPGRPLLLKRLFEFCSRSANLAIWIFEGPGQNRSGDISADSAFFQASHS